MLTLLACWELWRGDVGLMMLESEVLDVIWYVGTLGQWYCVLFISLRIFLVQLRMDILSCSMHFGFFVCDYDRACMTWCRLVRQS